MQHKSFRISDYIPQRDSTVENKPGVLVTLVHTEGSCYQKAGAQLYLSETQDVYGLISGGCLEHDIVRQAEQVQSSAEPRLVFFDTGDPLDVDFGYGLGCGGKLWVFFEAIFSHAELVEKMICRSLENQAEAIIIKAGRPELVGQRFLMKEGTQIHQDSVIDEIELDLMRCLSTKKISLIKDYKTDPSITVALIYRAAQPVLNIFGCGLGSWPLANLADTLGWEIRAFDHRPAYLQGLPTTLSHARQLDWDDTQAFTPPAKRPSASVIMTHNFQADRRILSYILRKPWPYIGLLGSQARSERLLSEICQEHPELEKSLAALRAPIGLDLGGTTPESIALAIVSEIQATWNQRKIIQPRSVRQVLRKDSPNARIYSS